MICGMMANAVPRKMLANPAVLLPAAVEVNTLSANVRQLPDDLEAAAGLCPNLEEESSSC